MTAHIDDTDLDALASQVRSHPQLADEELASVVGAAREDDEKAREKLVGNFLRNALAASLQRRDRGLDVADLYQEAVVAVVAVIAELTASAGSFDNLNSKIDVAIASALDAALEQLDATKKAAEQLIRDTSLLSVLRIRLKQETGTEPTTEQMAKLLKWPESRVEVVLDALLKAQATQDLEIVEFLDDE